MCCYQVPVGGRGSPARRLASGARTPNSRRLGFGEFVHGGSPRLGQGGVRVAAAAEQPSGRGAERDLSFEMVNRPAAWPAFDVTQRTRRQAVRNLQDLETGTDQEPAIPGCVQAESAGDPQGDGEKLRPGSLMPAQAASIIFPQCSSTSSEAVSNSCSLLSKWL